MATNRLLIKGGTIVNDDCMTKADVLIENGIVMQIGNDIAKQGNANVVDAEGLFVMPGGIDTRTHFQSFSKNIQSADDFFTGTQAALAGGTTMIIDVAIPSKGESLVESHVRQKKLASAKACCDYILDVGITTWNERAKQDIEALTKSRGVNSVQCFLGYSSEATTNDVDLYHIFSTCREAGALARIHAGNEAIASEEAKRLVALGVTGPEGHALSHSEELEAEAIQRAITIANQVNCPIFINSVMSQAVSHVITEARNKGVIVYGEPTAASLGTDGSHQWDKDWRHAAGYVTNPPLRCEGTPGHLITMLGNDGLHCTASHHRSFKTEDKQHGKDDFRKIPQGVNGVEDRMSIVWEEGVRSGLMDPCRFVAVTSSMAAKIYNIYPKKGRIAVGSDADIVLWDGGDKKRTISSGNSHESGDFNIFEGKECFGVAMVTISQGIIVYEHGKVTAVKGCGRFVVAKPFCPHVYNRIIKRQPLGQPQKVLREPRKSHTGGSVGEASTSRGPQFGHDDSTSNKQPAGPPMNFNQSSFKLSGEQVGDATPTRTSLKQKGQRETASHIILG